LRAAPIVWTLEKERLEMAETETRVTGGQVRMSRAYLRWSIAELADKAGVGISTVQAIEKAEGEPAISGAGLDVTRDYREGARDESLGKIGKALTRAGITLLPDNGEGAGIRGKVRKAR
jgi:DNA-binding XRE family transcriptional regulator